MERFFDLLSSELRLVALLSRPKMNAAQISEAKLLLKKRIDYTAFKALLDQHRVWPCVYLNIRSNFSHNFGQDITAYLEMKYQQNVSLRMRQFKIESKLLADFKKVQVPLASLKGNFLAKKLYGDVAKRHSNDIDLVTKPENLKKANEILNRHGFRCDIYDEFTQKQLNLYFRSHKDLSYINNTGQLIELHTRLTSRPSLLSQKFIGKLQSSEQQTEHSDYEFVYLCWHSAQNLHFRLKWLLDIALYIQQQTNRDKEFHNRIWPLAEKLEIERHVATSWIVSDIIFGLNISKCLPSFFLKNGDIIKLVEKSILALENNEKVKSLQYRLFWLMREPFFYKSFANKLSALASKFSPCSIDIHKMSNIPDSLLFIHYLIRPFFIVQRRLRNNIKDGI